FTLVSPTSGVVRPPGLYEPEPERATEPLRRILDPIGVEHLRAAMRTIDTGRCVVDAGGTELAYDRLVLAAGSALVRPDGLPGAEPLFDIDTLDGARRLAYHLRRRDRFPGAVVGAGFGGLEPPSALAGPGPVPRVA